MRRSLGAELEKAGFVSVIIPAYNAERFISRTLSSALGQTFANIEIVVVDDGSTDGTARIVRQFLSIDPRVRLFTTINQGVAAARNFGIEQARGEFVAFLDADDLWHPTKIQRQLDALKAHTQDPTWAAVYAFHHTIDEDDRVMPGGSTGPGCRGFLLARHLVLRLVGNGSALLVRRDAALDVGGFDPSYAKMSIGGCEDFDFELRLAARYRIDVVRSCLVGYRVYRGNMSSNGPRMARSMVETVARHVESNPGLPPKIKRWALGSAYRYAFQVLRREGAVVAAFIAFRQLAKNDPVLSCLSVVETVQAIWRRLGGRRVVTLRSSFFSVSAEPINQSPEYRLLKTRMRPLEEADRHLEDGCYKVDESQVVRARTTGASD